MDKLSYALGISLGFNLKNSGFDTIDYPKFAKGIEDAIEGNKTEISQEEAQAIINQHFEELQQKLHKANIEVGKDFLAENAKREKVVTTASGLQYEIIKKGDGAIPKATDSVTVHYHGTLLNGEVFDSSVQRGEPTTFGVTQVIQGWVEALQLMPAGSKWKLFIPHDLAYGAQGAGPSIAPYSTLIFEVELLEIV